MCATTVASHLQSRRYSNGTYPLGAGSRTGHDPERDEPAVQQLLRHADRRAATAPTGAGSRRWTWSRPRADFVLRADLPGLSEQDVNIELEDNVLTISGERKAEHEERKEGYYRVERSSGSFRRSLTLPEGVDPEAVKATFDRGVLEVRVPKPEQRKPRKVAITRRRRLEQPTIEGRSHRAGGVTLRRPRVRAAPAGPRPSAPAGQRSAQDAGVPQRVAPRLGPHAQAVRALADRDRGPQVAGRRCRSRTPPRCSGRSATACGRRPRRRPCRGWPACGSCQVLITRRVLKLTTEIEPAARLETYMTRGVAARVQAVGAGAGVQEADHAEACRVDLPQPAVACWSAT